MVSRDETRKIGKISGRNIIEVGFGSLFCSDQDS